MFWLEIHISHPELLIHGYFGYFPMCLIPKLCHVNRYYNHYISYLSPKLPILNNLLNNKFSSKLSQKFSKYKEEEVRVSLQVFQFTIDIGP